MASAAHDNAHAPAKPSLTRRDAVPVQKKSTEPATEGGKRQVLALAYHATVPPLRLLKVSSKEWVRKEGFG